MKIQCDVCSKNHASVFCTADEAALCDGCDHRVHHANKLATKHQRFSLHHPSSNQFPLCDVCQERRAFVFCQQDRAILCKECDLPIHSANDHTKKHSRFLLTGIKLSASTAAYTPPHPSPPSNPETQNSVLDSCNASQPLVLAKKNNISPSTAPAPAPPIINNNKGPGSGGGSLVANGEASGLTSSISEYLIKTIPGWQVEDLLDSPSVPFGFSSKDGDDDVLPLFDADHIEGNLVSFSAKNMGGIWVPQAPPSSLYSAPMDHQHIGYREAKEATNIKSSRSRLLGDDNFIVPEMSPASKRSRLLW